MTLGASHDEHPVDRVVTTDDREGVTVVVHGNVALLVRDLVAAAEAALERPGAAVVLDVSDAVGFGAPFTTAVNALASRGAVTVRARDEDGDALSALDPRVRVDPVTTLRSVPARTAAVPVVRAEPAMGVARKEGAGFISSYGAGRRCSHPGCATALSRYNEGALCSVHTFARRQRADGG